MKRESIFSQIDRSERFRRKMKERHKKHTASGKRRPNTCFQCRLEIAKGETACERSNRTAMKPKRKTRFHRNWDEVAMYEDGIPITFRELAAEELSHLSPLTREYLEDVREKG